MIFHDNSFFFCGFLRFFRGFFVEFMVYFRGFAVFSRCTRIFRGLFRGFFFAVFICGLFTVLSRFTRIFRGLFRGFFTVFAIFLRFSGFIAVFRDIKKKSDLKLSSLR
jgi:hypothetical protein